MAATVSVPRLKIFVSSPGDVARERALAERVLHRLSQEFSGRAEIQPYFWEYEPMRLTRDFQEQIPSTAEFDIVVCILWSRLGSRLHSKHARPDGRAYDSGTEYEFEQAVEHAQRHGLPDLLVYVNQASPPIPLEPLDLHQRLFDDFKRLKTFLDRWTRDDSQGVFKAAYTQYAHLGEFEHRLEQHLRKLILGRLPNTPASPTASARSWMEGSPFRGLQCFELAHAPVFFGRTRAVGEIVGAFQRQTLARVHLDNSAQPLFVLIAAMSGVGKSSLARAGVIPMLTKAGVIERIGAWRCAVSRPSDVVGSPFLSLARALLQSDALPEISATGLSETELAELLRTQAGPAGLVIKGALAQVALSARQSEETQLRQWQSEFEREGRRADATRIGQLLSGDPKKEARLILLVDQLEEIFTDGAVTAGVRAEFVRTLSALAGQGSIYVLSTMRADFFAQSAELPELMALQKGDGVYHLAPPTPLEITQMIRLPALAAGLVFEEDGGTHERLDDHLRDAAAKDGAALPLLEFALEQLYRKREGDRLTLQAYREMGGLEGALAQHAEASLSILPSAEREAFPELVRLLVTLSPGTADTPVRRRAELSGASANVARLADQLVAARLLVADRAADGQVVYALAHEALLRCWPSLTQCLDHDREFFKARAELTTRRQLWEQQGRDNDYLITEDKPFERARKLLKQRAGELTPQDREYVTRSEAHRRNLSVARQVGSTVSRLGSGVKDTLSMERCALVFLLLLAWFLWRDYQNARFEVNAAREAGYRPAAPELAPSWAARLASSISPWIEKLPFIKKAVPIPVRLIPTPDWRLGRIPEERPTIFGNRSSLWEELRLGTTSGLAGQTPTGSFARYLVQSGSSPSGSNVPISSFLTQEWYLRMIKTNRVSLSGASSGVVRFPSRLLSTNAFLLTNQFPQGKRISE